MSVSSGEKSSGEGSVEIGPPPYYHRSDCNICRKQDDLKTGSKLLDVPRPGGYIVEGEHSSPSTPRCRSAARERSYSRPGGMFSISPR